MSGIEQDPMMNEDPEPGALSTAAIADADADSSAHLAEEPKSFSPQAGGQGERPKALLPENEVSDLRNRWMDIQGGFVDEPRRAVQEADGLVAQTMKRLAETFAKERSSLEGQWDRGDQVSTEELRVAMQRYRSFFDRLLSV
jgi:hypothetical protein